MLHRRFCKDQGAFGSCNDGNIVGSSLGFECANSYTSQLNISLTLDLVGKNIQCIHDNDGNITNVGQVNITSGMYIIILCHL